MLMAKQWSDYGPILTTEQTAEIMQVSYRTVLRMINDGRLTARRIGKEWRFSKRYVMAYIGDDPDEVDTGDAEQLG